VDQLCIFIFVPYIFGDCFVKVLLMKRQGALLASWSFSQKERKKVELSKPHCGHYNDKWIWYRLQENIREKLEFYQIGHSSTHPSSSGINSYIASPHGPWILTSGASSHMTGIKNKFTSLHLSTQFSYVNIADGT